VNIFNVRDENIRQCTMTRCRLPKAAIYSANAAAIAWYMYKVHRDRAQRASNRCACAGIGSQIKVIASLQYEVYRGVADQWQEKLNDWFDREARKEVIAKQVNGKRKS
jgi:hypothetical protein